jgi:hypothetical protein
MKRIGLIVLLAVTAGIAALAQSGKSLYANNFDKAPSNAVPDDMLVLDGGFAVKEEAGNRFLELPGDPLESFGVIFGPSEKENLSVTARIHGTGKGRRFPTFGVGLGGVGGYRLQVSPGKKQVELYRNDAVLTAVPFDWASDSWTALRLQVRKVKDGAWQVEGKVWKHGGPEPKDWMITHADTTEPVAGRQSIWGMPYAGTPIRYDDLSVTTLGQ